MARTAVAVDRHKPRGSVGDVHVWAALATGCHQRSFHQRDGNRFVGTEIGTHVFRLQILLSQKERKTQSGYWIIMEG